MLELFNVHSDYSKMNEYLESCREIKRVYHDPDLTKTAKTVEIIAQGTFLATQTAEFELRKNVSVAPVVRTANGIADIVKTGVHAYIRQEDLKETVVKVGKKVMTHTHKKLLVVFSKIHSSRVVQLCRRYTRQLLLLMLYQ